MIRNENLAAPKRESAVMQGMVNLERMIEKITESISILRMKLEPVLRVTSVAGAESLEKEKEVLVPLVGIIRTYCNKLSMCDNEIREITEKCEL